MKIGFFAYNLSGTGPRTRAKDIINGIDRKPEAEVTVLTNEPEKLDEKVETKEISLNNPLHLFISAKEIFSRVDIAHVPINIWQVAFVRLFYRGPLVAGVGPGIQPEKFSKVLGRFLHIDHKISVRERNNWKDYGYNTTTCTATIDRNEFYPYDESRIRQIRDEIGVSNQTDVILYVGRLTKSYGAEIFLEMAQIDTERDYIAVGEGPLQEEFEEEANILYEGYIKNEELPKYYNIADITVGPRKTDVTSNVGLESISCGTPFITTAKGYIEEFAKDDRAYVWADRNTESIINKIKEIVSEEQIYEEQVKRGLTFIEENPLTLRSAVETHLKVYNELSS